jgi:hypothetical protein
MAAGLVVVWLMGGLWGQVSRHKRDCGRDLRSRSRAPLDERELVERSRTQAGWQKEDGWVCGRR